MPALKNALLALTTLLVLSACAPQATDTAADEAAIRAGTTTWAAAYNAGEVDKMVALYAEDAVVMPPDAPSAIGHAAIREYLAADTAASKAAGITLVMGEEAAGVSGNLGWHSGTFKVTNAAGDTVGTGKFTEVLCKADGKWLMIRDIWNNDAPAPAAAPASPAAVPAPAK